MWEVFQLNAVATDAERRTAMRVEENCIVKKGGLEIERVVKLWSGDEELMISTKEEKEEYTYTRERVSVN